MKEIIEETEALMKKVEKIFLRNFQKSDLEKLTQLFWRR